MLLSIIFSNFSLTVGQSSSSLHSQMLQYEISIISNFHFFKVKEKVHVLTVLTVNSAKYSHCAQGQEL